jgi:hypothetical protein
MSFVAGRHLTNLALRFGPDRAVSAYGTKHHVQRMRLNGALQTGRFCWLLRLVSYWQLPGGIPGFAPVGLLSLRLDGPQPIAVGMSPL